MRKSLLLVLCALLALSTNVHAQKRKQAKKTEPEVVLSPEEIAAAELAERQSKHAEEMLANTQIVTFVDSAVVDKDAFITQLRLTSEAGRFMLPDNLFADGSQQPATGRSAYVNGLSNTVLFSAAGDSGVMQLHAAYRNGGQWSKPTPLEGIGQFDYADYPFLLSDGTTLYFAAEGEESIGGLDIFVTRYNNDSHQYVRAENVGFPFNSPANEYMLAIDESIGLGVLATDRRQPDDKVCLYWFIVPASHEVYDLDPDDEEEGLTLRCLAAIERIADTQSDQSAVAEARKRWLETIAKNTHKSNDARHRFAVNDTTVYTDLAQFVSSEAKEKAAMWVKESATLRQLEDELATLRHDYAITHSTKIESRILNLEVQTMQQRSVVKRLMKEYINLENSALGRQ